MHLLNCSLDGQGNLSKITLREHFGKPPPYAILSHRWRQDPRTEVLFKDCQDIENIATDPHITSKAGYKKVSGCCERALQDGYEHVWIDTACIDKSSSAELSEAINSMYSWYEMSHVCYAYLEDVSSDRSGVEGPILGQEFRDRNLATSLTIRVLIEAYLEAVSSDRSVLGIDKQLSISSESRYWTIRRLTETYLNGSSSDRSVFAFEQEFRQSSWFRNGQTLQSMVADHLYHFSSDRSVFARLALVRQFRDSAWFKRGWTLQELIAPSEVVFFDWEWNEMGNKAELASIISGITKVDKVFLTYGFNVRKASIAEKMSWAANRETTREEDRAYSLMGLFLVNMPTLYGEGSRAFKRLQEEIIRTDNDHSILAWRGLSIATSVLAVSPDQFANTPVCWPVKQEAFITAFKISNFKPQYSMTNLGLYIQLPLAQIEDCPGYYYAFLACSTAGYANFEPDELHEWPVMYLRKKPGGSNKEYERTNLHDDLLGFRTVRNLRIEVQRILISVDQNIWPLVWRSYVPDSNLSYLPEFSHVTERIGRNLILDMEAHVRGFEIADAWPTGMFLAPSRVALRAHSGKWCCKYSAGQNIYPVNSSKLLGGHHMGSLQTPRLHQNYGNGHHVVALVIQNGIIGRQTLVVLVIMDGLWLISLTNTDDNESARDCYNRLFVDDDNPLKAWHAMLIPFSLEHVCSIGQGRFCVTVAQVESKNPAKLERLEGPRFRVAFFVVPPQEYPELVPISPRVTRYLRLHDPHADCPDEKWENSDLDTDYDHDTNYDHDTD